MNGVSTAWREVVIEAVWLWFQLRTSSPGWSEHLIKYVSFLQGILPYAAYSGIKELFVPEEKVEEAKKEAEELPSVELTKVGPALVRIHCDWMSQNQNLKKKQQTASLARNAWGNKSQFGFRFESKWLRGWDRFCWPVSRWSRENQCYRGMPSTVYWKLL